MIPDAEDLWRAGLGDMPLVAEDHWGVWKPVPNGGSKPDKVPTPPFNAPWWPYRMAIAKSQNGGGYAGLGFNVLAAGRSAFDLDHCRDKDTGEIDERALELVEQCGGAYCEVSPSGTGLKIIGAKNAEPRFLQVDFKDKVNLVAGIITNYTAVTFDGQGDPDVDISSVIDSYSCLIPKSASGRYEPTDNPDSRHLELFKMLRSEKARGRSYKVALAACLAHNEEFPSPLPERDLLPYLERSWNEPDKIKPEKAQPPRLVGFGLADLLAHQFPSRRVLLTRGGAAVLRAGNIAQVFAYRGFGKTWFLESLALVAAYRVEALSFHAPDPSRVLYVDGEMASEDVQKRFALLCALLGVVPAEEPWLTIVGADWQEAYLPRLDTPEGQGAIEEFVEPADLVILDNRSSLFDPEGEKDPSVWQLAQDYLLSLRRRGKAVVMAHHANRQGGARGIGKAEDVIDLNLKLSRPEDYRPDQGARFLVEFDKARGVHGPAAATFEASLGEHGWATKAGGAEKDVRQKIRDYLATAPRLELPTSANQVYGHIKGNRQAVLEALASMRASGEVVKTAGQFHLGERKLEGM